MAIILPHPAALLWREMDARPGQRAYHAAAWDGMFTAQLVPVDETGRCWCNVVRNGRVVAAETVPSVEAGQLRAAALLCSAIESEHRIPW